MTDKEQKIKQLEEEVERLTAEKNSLLKVASHDIRSPLNKIFALVNLIKMADGELNSEQEGYLSKIETVLNDGLSKMRNLMELRAIENDEIKLRFEEIDLRAVLTRIVREYQIICNRKKINLVLSAETVSTTTDKLSVVRILDQLLANALKFSPVSGNVLVTLSAEEEVVQIDVIDAGYGIKPEEQVDLFKKFKVLSTPTTGGESRTGLGLYIAKYYAEKLAGSLTYTNEEAGSTFSLTLPRQLMA